MRQSTFTRTAAAAAAILAVTAGLAVLVSSNATAEAEQARHRREVSRAAADQVAVGSGLLTDSVRAFTATGDKAWLDQYWTEVDVTKSRSEALDQLKAQSTPQSELELVAQSVANSDELVKAETRAMRLVLGAAGTPASSMPAAVAEWRLDPADAALSPAKKLALARTLVHDTTYQDEVVKIMSPLRQFKETLSHRVDTEVAEARQRESLTESWLAGAALALAVALGLVLALFHRGTGRPIQAFTAALRQRDPQDPRFRLQPQGVTEMHELAAAFNAQSDQVAEVIGAVESSASSLFDASAGLSAVAQHLGDSSQRTSKESRTTSDSAEAVSANISSVAAGAEQMSSSIGEIAGAANRASAVAGEAVTAAEGTSVTVTKLSESSALIGEVMKSITSIAEQTNLLALNATIEAARAGDAGKGFAVVANEVKELARQTAEATEDISQKVAGIQGDARATADALSLITEVITRIDETQSTIAAAVEEQTATTNEITQAVNDAARGAAEIAQNTGRVSTAADETSHGAEGTLGASEQMAQMAKSLQDLVGRFTVAS